MEAAQRAWTMFNDKLTCRKKLLSTADDIDQIVAQVNPTSKAVCMACAIFPGYKLYAGGIVWRIINTRDVNI